MYREKDKEDLRNEIIVLKKRNTCVEEENHLLKVKIRKLEAQLDKKDKQLEAIIQPVKSQNYRKVVNEQSAVMVLKMNEKIDKLEKILQEKDVLIKRLQDQLQMAKIYSQNKKRTSSKDNKYEDKILKFLATVIHNNGREGCSPEAGSLPDLDVGDHDTRPRSSSWTPGLNRCRSADLDVPISENQEHEFNQQFNSKDPYENLSREHLLSIIGNLKDQQINRQKNCSPESDLDRIELYEPTHVEIQKLQSHFFDMLLEVDLLKNTINSLQEQHEKTQEILKDKDICMGELAEEVKYLRIDSKHKTCSKVNRPGKQLISNVEKIYRPRSYKKPTKMTRENSKLIFLKSIPNEKSD